MPCTGVVSPAAQEAGLLASVFQALALFSRTGPELCGRAFLGRPHGSRVCNLTAPPASQSDCDFTRRCSARDYRRGEGAPATHREPFARPTQRPAAAPRAARDKGCPLSSPAHETWTPLPGPKPPLRHRKPPPRRCKRPCRRRHHQPPDQWAPGHHKPPPRRRTPPPRRCTRPCRRRRPKPPDQSRPRSRQI